MNATKRKFNALLNGIGTKSTTSLSKEVNNEMGSAGDADLQTKKRRVADLTSNKTSNLTPTIKHKKSASLATASTATESPKYAPWDRTEFLRRLKSFSNLTDWTPKPARVNEVEWAKRGWVCQKFERVRCCLCNVEILVKLNRKEVDGKEQPVYIAQNIGTADEQHDTALSDFNLEDALVEKYVELIITSHEENCLWRKRGCDDSIFKLPLSHAPTTIQTLRERYDELSTRTETLPYMFNMKTPPDFDLDVIFSYLPRDFFKFPPRIPETENPIPTPVNRVAFLMALFGWQGHTHDRLGVQIGSVSCHACFRVLGLWLFKSKKVNEAGEEIDGPVVNCLDVVKEHRDYCPWQNPTSQNGQTASTKSSTNSMAGWEIVLRVLKNDYYLRANREDHGRPSKQPSTDNASEIASTFETEHDDEDARSVRDEKDKERWSRLRRVKSLFNTKEGNKLKRPDTAKSKNP